ncbi:MAG TPA: Wzz/FepE/Etk N-terminal domain-containing protein [Acidimicrobiales bacterium]|nr:Wzz/FepE/Etk N-terminal domain-containing protein [Acidimicrobiales bacterium]
MQTATEGTVQAYARTVWHRRWVVTAVTLFAVVVALLYCLATSKQYDATSELLLAPQLPSAVLQANDPAASQGTVDVPTAVQVITSGQVASLVRKSLGTQAPPVTVAQVGATAVVKITVESPNPELARRAADAYANAYLDNQRQQVANALQQAAQVLQQRLQAVEQAVNTVSGEISANAGNGSLAGAQTELATTQQALQVEQSTLQNQLTTYQSLVANQTFESGQLISPATTPTKPAKPKTVEYVVLALILGIVFGVLLALLVDVLSGDRAGRTGVGPSVNGHGGPGGGDGYGDRATARIPATVGQTPPSA